METKDRPYLIAGPCSAESESQVFETARRLCGVGVDAFRAGIWKPRTRPGCFEGVGEPGLAWLSRVRDELGMRVCTEVAVPQHVEACLRAGIDMVWIGARTTASPFLVQELADAVAGTGISVFIKNPVNPDLSLWCGAVERFERAGVGDIGLIHRGFSSFENMGYRNAPQWQIAAEMRRLHPSLSLLCDPSHMGGRAESVRELSQRAMDLGFDGLMVEAHRSPAEALSDAGQQVTPEMLAEMLSGLKLRNMSAVSSEYDSSVSVIRARIDALDESLLRTLALRMELCREIGARKKAGNVAILQPSRWDDVLRSVTGKARELGLDPDFVVDVFNSIHAASIAEQNIILEKDDSKN